MAIVNGKAFWSKVYEVDRMYPKDKTGGTWSIELVVDEHNFTTIEKEGLSHLINVKPDGTKSIKFKRNELKKADGKPNTPPKVIDAHKNPMTDLIGNGSFVNISFTTYTGYKSKTYPTLQAVQVVTLVPYKKSVKGSGDAFWDMPTVEGGYNTKGDDDEPPFESDAKAV